MTLIATHAKVLAKADGADVSKVRPLSDWNAGHAITGGQRTAIAFSAGNFTASAGTWVAAVGDVTECSFVRVGRLAWMYFNVATTTITGSPQHLRFALPAGWVIAGRGDFALIGRENGVYTPVQAVAAVGNAFIAFFKGDISNWANLTDLTTVAGTIGPIELTTDG